MIDWTKIEALRTAHPVEPKPEGFFTAEEYAAQTGIPLNTARGRVYAMYAAGKLRREKYGKGYAYALKD